MITLLGLTQVDGGMRRQMALLCKTSFVGEDGAVTIIVIAEKILESSQVEKPAGESLLN